MIDTGTPENIDQLLDARPGTSRQRVIVRTIVVIAIIALGFLMLRFLTGHDTPYILHKLEQGDLQPQLTAKGIVHSSGELQIRAPFAGLVTPVLPEGAKRITKGQILARMDTSNLQAHIAEIQAREGTAKAEIQVAEASLAEAKAQLSRIEKVYKESGGRVPSRGELEVARADVAQKQSEVELARRRVAEWQTDMAQSRQRLAAATIRSPVDGFLIEQRADAGYVAKAPGDVLFVIATNMGQLEIPVNAEDTVANGLAQGASADIVIDNIPGKSFSGSVKRISPEPDAGDLSTQQVVVAVNNADLAITPGMRATVNIALPERKNVFLVPNAAFHIDPKTDREIADAEVSHATIFLLDGDDSARPIDVVVGASDGQLTEVRSPDLKSGDLVIAGWRSAPDDAPENSAGNAN
ncbi:efflux RND transporter periplasmic adaptor subunit [Altererythrobacter indicus]|uniref:Efflux RND transporter periplasmic adaptor subunit n=1 Tax=Altericroceibacterium indicum TaxID=374177 RepID=A0A845A9V2_9SPHN|nr:efflux RND transporter periplasmic adaptor subunit [Altericroceibacterium indicum]MXP25575.1 efflux RND transporter periplasmic adaptor subunit [Altericroceibacterium indicum]